jgi:methyl-accepting chemotaxis protein
VVRATESLAANADDLNVSAEQASSSVNEMAASIEEVSVITESLNSNVETVSSSIEEISRSIQSVAQNAENISGAATSAVSAASQMDRSLRSVAGISKRAEDVTKRLTREAEEGGSAAQKSIQSLSRVRTAMELSAGVIREMGKRSDEIGGIVNTINVISERTNMLSLNASIEAARAGDAGRGFAVVAEEIRNLADRAAQATSDIAAIIRSLQEVAREAISASSEGLRVAEEGGQIAEEGSRALQRILSGVHETADFMSQVARSTDENLVASQSVVGAIDTVAAQSKQVAYATVEQAKTAQSIVKGAGQMSKTAREVSQAMYEQGTAAREIVKAAQNTTAIATQVRRSSKEQSLAAKQGRPGGGVHAPGCNQYVACARRTSQGQRTSVERIHEPRPANCEREQGDVRTVCIHFSDCGDHKENGRLSEQIARGMSEQSRASRDTTTSIDSISKDVRTISRSNREHLDYSGQVLKAITDIRNVTTQNAVNAQALTSGAKGLTERARSLAELMVSVETGHQSGNQSNGNAMKSPRKRTRKAGNSEEA